MTKSCGLFWTSILLSRWIASMMDRQECVILSWHRARSPDCRRRRRRLIEISCAKEKNWWKMRRFWTNERKEEEVSSLCMTLISVLSARQQLNIDRRTNEHLFLSGLCRWKHQHCPLKSAVGWSSTALTSLFVVRWSRESSLLICSYSSKLCYCVRWSMRERSMNNGFAVRQRARRLVNIEITTERRWKMTRFSPLPVRLADRWAWLSISSSLSLCSSARGFVVVLIDSARTPMNIFDKSIDRSFVRSSLSPWNRQTLDTDKSR